MSIARPIRETEADRELDDALRRIRIVYRSPDGTTDWDRFYDVVRKRQEAAKTSGPLSPEAEDQNDRTGTDPA